MIFYLYLISSSSDDQMQKLSLCCAKLTQVIVVNTGHEHKTMHDINKIKIDGQNLAIWLL